MHFKCILCEVLIAFMCQFYHKHSEGNMMKKLLLLLSFTVPAAFASASIENLKALDSNFLVELNRTEQARKIVAWERAIIKTETDLENLLASGSKSPLDNLSSGTKSEFLSSLVFRENGIGGFAMGGLEAELSVSKIYEVLELFGVQHTIKYFKRARIENSIDLMLLQSEFSPLLTEPTPGVPGGNDYSGYRCWERATCKKASNYICTSNC